MASRLPVFCEGCEQPIEACNGRYGDWMHSDGRSEHCPAGGLARPERPPGRSMLTRPGKRRKPRAA